MNISNEVVLEEVLRLSENIKELGNHIIIFNNLISKANEAKNVTVESLLGKAYQNCHNFKSFKRIVDNELRDWYDNVNSKLN